jgi:cell division protein FtsQ
VEAGDSSAALLGLSEMKMGTQRGSVSAAVLEAPEVSYAPAAESAWRGQEPAPAGALQRGYGADFSEPAGYREEEEEYRPRRGAGKLRPNVRTLMRSLGGRIILGVTAFVVVGGLAVAVAAARYYVLHDPRFVLTTASDIEISGNEHLTRQQILSVFGGDLQRNIFRLSLDERRSDLENLPWVEHATVMRLLPNRIRVQVKERTPVAFVRQGTQIGLADASGVLLDMPANAAAEHYSFPVLTGVAASDSDTARAARMQIYGRFVKELDNKGQQLTKNVSEVDVSDPEDVKVLMGSPEILVHFGDEQFLDRYNEFESHLPGWKQQYPKLASADMRYEGQIVLEMQKGETAGAPAVPALASLKAAESPVAQSHVSEARHGAPGRVTPPAAKAAPIASAQVPKPLTPKTTVAKVPAPALLAAAPKAVPAPKVVTPKVVPVKAVVGKPAKPLAKTVAAKPGKLVVKPAIAHASGSSAANEKMFAALAAQRKAAMAKSGGVQ